MMKLTYRALILPLAAIICFSFAANASAFHDGGVAECEGCHTMHNSYMGAKMTVTGTVLQGKKYLLKGSDPSSTCLNCHDAPDIAPTGYHISTDESKLAGTAAPVERTPGGDFGWLRKSYTWTNSDDGASMTSPGERHGHNVIAADYNYVQDSTQMVAPGWSPLSGTDPYPSASLSCISCHDPHGEWRISLSGGYYVISKTGLPIGGSGSYGDLPTSATSVGVYRLLGGVGYQPPTVTGNVAFTNPPFYAVVPADYNRSEATSSVRVAYGRKSADWCANCHAGMLTSEAIGQIHPAGVPITNTAYLTNYNTYVKTADMTGSQATAFTSLVPFQIDASTDLTILKTASTSTAGPKSGDQVTCFTCHRAHASGWSSILRWNMDATFITYGGAYGDPNSADPRSKDTACGRTQAETQAAYYDRPASYFATYQRVLCNKCHAKDVPVKG
jgi:hypothetical protein